MTCSFRLLAAASTPGDTARVNDDAWCAQLQLAAVLDGATGLGSGLLPGPSDAAWLASQGADRLAARAGSLKGRSLIRAVLEDIEAAFVKERLRPPLERYETPMASLMMVELALDQLAAFWFGDCTAIVQRPGEPAEVVGDALDTRSDETDRAAALGAASGVGPAGVLSRPEFLADRRAARNQRNVEGGQWVFSPDVRCADHVQTSLVAAPEGSLVLLASDGFTALISDYGRYDAQSLMDAVVTCGFGPLLEELRAIEEADPGGARYPRFKKSDDATAVLLQVVGPSV